ncbi:MAG: ABC transporter permease [Sphaerochaetaceae bacterium]|nr:ABC transporter permease [Sphaerochaetaceae bacterium]
MKVAENGVLTAKLKKYNLLLLLAFFVIIASILSPRFLTFQNFFNLLQQSAIVGIVAVGMTFVILTGGIDLSVGSHVAFAGMISSIFSKNLGLGVFPSFVLAILCGAIFGSLTGFFITTFRIPAFITTLAMMTSLRGLALLVTNGKPIFGLSDAFRKLGAGFVFDVIPISGLVWIVITVLAFLLLKYLPFGRKFYAIGGNESAAYLSGIRTKYITTAAYTVSGALSAFAGVMLASWLSTGQPNAGSAMELDAIASGVIGGTSLSGGVGGVLGTFGGVMLLTIISNIPNLVGVPSYFQQIVKGIIILLALIGNNLLTQRKN